MEPLDFLTVREFSEFLRVSTQWTRDEIHGQKIKAIRVGKNYRIPRSELERLIRGDDDTAA